MLLATLLLILHVSLGVRGVATISLIGVIAIKLGVVCLDLCGIGNVRRWKRNFGVLVGDSSSWRSLLSAIRLITITSIRITSISMSILRVTTVAAPTLAVAVVTAMATVAAISTILIALLELLVICLDTVEKFLAQRLGMFNFIWRRCTRSN